MGVGSASLFLLAGIGVSLCCLWVILSAFGRLSLFQKLTKLLHRAFLRTRTFISHPFSGFDMPTFAKRIGNLLFKICLSFELLIPLS